ncbi:MAG TPA: dolichyl-phosphate beta-glucosyltransferase [Candidatus Polarisedimenticolia bacterium]|nr:dolichyl-phosphate beta-glucosyltransferase [Candidatus Polarisedimenticolia bacterium]
MPAPRLSVVIPAYNEQGRLGPSLASVLAYARRAPFDVEIVVVDDGSSDQTARVARAALASWHSSQVLANDRNHGKGYSVRRGALAARGELLLLSDADLSTPIEETDRLLGRLGEQGGGIVIGSRAVRGARVEVHQNPVREAMGKVFNRVVRLLTGLPFHDTQCGFKLMARADVVPLFEAARIDGFGYDVELLYVAARKGIPIREEPVIWRNAPGSKVGILTDPARMLRDVWRVRQWYARGVYGAAGAGRKAGAAPDA